MDYKQIVQNVQEQVGLGNEKEAEKTLHAVLGTLGENVPRMEERHLAAQLPKELKDVFDEYQGPDRNRAGTANYPLEEFYNRVQARAKLTSFQEAQRQSKIVLHILHQLVGAGEIQDILREMPYEFKDLFDIKNVEIRQREPEAERVFDEYYIAPGENGKWTVKKGTELLGQFDTKEAAIVYADDVAVAEQGDILVIHNIDGSISKREAPSRELK
jgi:uncharacterized protein (DUF2267 family)